MRRSHSVFDNIKWLQEAWKNPIFINAYDAKIKNLQDGDTVLVENEYGKVLRNALVTECLMPGVVALPHGAWSDVDPKTGIDKGGADNTLSGQFATGQGVSGYNSCIVNISKFNDQLINDVKKPQRIVL